MSKDTKQENPEVIVISKEKAVFWMDGQGRWRNRHGLFSHKGIIDHFNGAIQKDADGYFVAQTSDNVVDKVYFRCEETAIFAVDVILETPAVLLLNTGARIELVPDKLFIFKDYLYQREKEHIVKWTERAMVKLTTHIALAGNNYTLLLNGSTTVIPEVAQLSDGCDN